MCRGRRAPNRLQSLENAEKHVGRKHRLGLSGWAAVQRMQQDGVVLYRRRNDECWVIRYHNKASTLPLDSHDIRFSVGLGPT